MFKTKFKRPAKELLRKSEIARKQKQRRDNAKTKKTPEGVITYITDYRIPVDKDVRKTICSKVHSVIAAYLVHYKSNISRIEYEISKSGDLMKIFSTASRVDKYVHGANHFELKFDNGILITCHYMQNYERKYCIYNGFTRVYTHILDSPVMTEAWDDET